MWFGVSPRFRLGLPPVKICRFCGFLGWAGRLGYLVDVTLYLFLSP